MSGSLCSHAAILSLLGWRRVDSSTLIAYGSLFSSRCRHGFSFATSAGDPLDWIEWGGATCNCPDRVYEAHTTTP